MSFQTEQQKDEANLARFIVMTPVGPIVHAETYCAHIKKYYYCPRTRKWRKTDAFFKTVLAERDRQFQQWEMVSGMARLIVQ